MHQREMHESMAEIAPGFELQRRIVGPGQPNHHRLIAQQILQDKHRDADEQNRPGERAGVMPQRGKERKALIAQPAIGLSGLPARRQITRVRRVLKEAGQLSPDTPGLTLISQPDVALGVLLNGQDNPLRRHIIDKRLGHPWIGKRGNH